MLTPTVLSSRSTLLPESKPLTTGTNLAIATLTIRNIAAATMTHILLLALLFLFRFTIFMNGPSFLLMCEFYL